MFPMQFANPFTPRAEAAKPLLLVAAGLAAGLVQVDDAGRLVATTKGEKLLASIQPANQSDALLPILQAR